MRMITEAVFGNGRPSKKSKGPTFAAFESACTESRQAPGERK